MAIRFDSMIKILPFIFLLFSFALSTIAQEQSFEAFKNAVQDSSGGFGGNKQVLSRVFNAERVKLGDRFEPEVWTYLGDDPEKHFWIALFITARSYLHGNKPFPELADRIRERALTLLKDVKDEESLGRKYNILREMAIAAKQTGNQTRAIEYRSRAENILENYRGLSPYISGLSDFERCIYANVQTEIVPCKEDSSPKETIISAGVLNGRTTSQPTPLYPAEIKRKGIGGQVVVKVLSDINGNILSAEVVSGPPALHNVSKEAALRAKLSPTKLSGQLTKVSGVIIYTFKP